MILRATVPFLVLAAVPAAAQILNGPAAPNAPIGPGLEARAGVPSIVGSPRISLPRRMTPRRDDAVSDSRCQQDGRGRAAVRAADGEVRCVDRSQVGKLR